MKKDRVSTLNIATPEGVTFSVPLAGPVLRSAAYFIDLFILMGLMKILGYFLGVLQLLGDVGVGLSILINFVVMEGARMVCELLWHGQTPGKKALGLRVMDERELNRDTTPPSP